MKSSDLFGMALHNLRQRRIRTLLNLVGIVTGCIVLLMTAAGTSGVRQAFHTLFESSDFTRHIYLFPRRGGWEEPPEGTIVIDAKISDARRERIRRAMVNEWNADRPGSSNDHEISLEKLEAIRQLPHVVSVIPEATTSCTISSGTSLIPTWLGPLDLHSVEASSRLVAGSLPMPDDREGVLVDEFVAWKMGYRDDADLPKLIGQPLSIEYRIKKAGVASIYGLLSSQQGALDIGQIQQQTQFLQTLVQLIGDLDRTTLSEEQKNQLRSLIGSGLGTDQKEEIVCTRTFIVRGIAYSGSANSVTSLFRQWFMNRSGGGLMIHPDVATEIYLSRPDTTSFFNATATVDRSTNLEEVTMALGKLKLQPQSALGVLKNIDYQIEQSSWIIYGIAVAILLTAAVGMSNALVLSIVERTPEFGIMKSLGARDSDILKLMIAEGAILGLIGATIAVLVSIVLGTCGQFLLKAYVESQAQTELAGNLFQFRMVPALLIVAISVTLCIFASILPAWRAARLDPIVAMRRV